MKRRAKRLRDLRKRQRDRCAAEVATAHAQCRESERVRDEAIADQLRASYDSVTSAALLGINAARTQYLSRVAARARAGLEDEQERLRAAAALLDRAEKVLDKAVAADQAGRARREQREIDDIVGARRVA